MARISSQGGPDGYTLRVGVTGSHAINTSLMKSMPYHTRLRDFEPLTLATIFPNGDRGRRQGARDHAARADRASEGNRPATATASDGNGNGLALTMELLKSWAASPSRTYRTKGARPWSPI